MVRTQDEMSEDEATASYHEEKERKGSPKVMGPGLQNQGESMVNMGAHVKKRGGDRRGGAAPVSEASNNVQNNQPTNQFAIIQYANLKKNYIQESRIVEGYRKRIKAMEREVANLRKEESGMGVKKLRLRKTKLDKHCEKMDSLVEAERNQRVQSEKDVVELTTEVGVYSQKYEEITKQVEDEMVVKTRLEFEIQKRKDEYEAKFKEQNDRLSQVEKEFEEMEKMLLMDNFLRNNISAAKGSVEEELDGLKDLLGKEEENLEHDKEFVLKDINNLKLKATKAALRRLSMMRADGNKRMSMMPEDPQGGWAKVDVTGVTKQMKEQMDMSKRKSNFRADRKRLSIMGSRDSAMLQRNSSIRSSVASSQSGSPSSSIGASSRGSTIGSSIGSSTGSQRSTMERDSQRSTLLASKR